MTGGRRDRERRARALRRLLETDGENVSSSLTHYNELRYQSTDELGAEYPALKADARAIKEDAIDRLPELIETVTAAVEDRGGSVHVAETAAEAREHVLDVVEAANAETLAKSKSMTCAEIDLRESLEEAGYRVTETDLGELVLQFADDTPSHIVGPSVHLSTTEIASLFESRLDLDATPEDATELTELAREYVGDRIREADVGITGANFVVAESGSIALVTNEGNARKVIESTNTLVTVAGIEKLVPSIGDLSPFVELLGRSAGEPGITAYTSVFTPPIATPSYPFEDEDTDREFHLVLLDNGRMEMRSDDTLREALYCIRCGACADSCANFQQIGGHGFGGETYTGGIAPSWEAGVHGMDSAGSFTDLCTGCSRCVNQCPVGIDIPWLNTVVRQRLNAMDGAGAIARYLDTLVPDAEPAETPLRKRLFGNFGTVARVASALAPVSNRVATSKPVKRGLDRVLGIDSRRDLPAFATQTFTTWAGSRRSRGGTRGGTEAVLYPDLYTQYILVDRGRAAVEALEDLGVEVVVPSVTSTGRPALSQGMVDTAEERAHTLYDTLKPHVDAGRDIVVVEPTDVAMVRRDYERLLPTDAYETLAENTYELVEYIQRSTDDDADLGAIRTRDGTPGRVVYHRNCQQRTLGLGAPTVNLLTALGYDVVTTDVECCGMAGSFGYKAEYYDLSRAVGETLAEQIRSGGEDAPVLTSGMSCAKQLDDLVEQRPRHPIEFLRSD